MDDNKLRVGRGVEAFGLALGLLGRCGLLYGRRYFSALFGSVIVFGLTLEGQTML